MTRTRRAGFTLVEMLVVMGLIVILAAIAVGVSESGAFGSGRVVGGADRVSGWLLIAKQRALRDARPRGVRFLLTQEPGAQNTASPNWQTFSYAAREAQYIESPDQWAPNPTNDPARPKLVLSAQTMTAPAPVAPKTRPLAGTPVVVNRAFFVTETVADDDEFSQRVAANDLLMVGGHHYRIERIDPAVPVRTGPAAAPTDYPGGSRRSRELILEVADPEATEPYGRAFPPLGAANSGGVSTPPQGTIVASQFAFQAQPRPLVGEPLLQLTGSSAIDVRSKTFTPPIGDGTAANARWGTSGSAAWLQTSLGLRLQPFEVFDPTSPPGTPRLPQYFDILFAPSGQVLGTDSGVVALWVRDPDKTPHPRLRDQAQFATNPGLDDPAVTDAAGEQVLVVVSPRTGLIATQPVTKGSDPHAAAKDGINSGL